MAQTARAAASAKAAPKKERSGTAVVQPRRAAPAVPRVAPRAAPCACGGHCPKCQRQARAPDAPSSALREDDAAEKEAEQLARVLSQAFAGAAPIPPPDANHPAGAPLAVPRLGPPPRRRLQPTARPDASLGSGAPLPDALRRRLEPALGFDLSSLRIHADPSAHRLAERYGARAFAFGSHLIFARGEYAPDRASGQSVLAHEVVHAIQQSPVARDPWSSGSLSTQARPRGPPSHGAPLVSVQHCFVSPRVQRLPGWKEVSNTFVAAGSAAVDTAVDLGSSAVGVAVDIGEGALEVGAEVIERTADFFVGLIDDYAPGLLEFLRGGFMSRLTDLFCRGLDAVIGGLISSLEDIDFVSALEEAFSSAQGSVEGVIGAIRSGASSALGSLMQPVVEALDEYGPGIIDAITGASDSVNGFFDSIWESIGAPAMDFLGEAGGAIWEEISEMIDWLWEATADVREAAADAWDWVMEQFGIAWESTSGIREWLAEKATEAWDAMKEALGPLEGPITVLLGILLVLSPLGPIIIATQVIPPLWEKLVWLWNNWNTDDILVWAQDTLRENILPGIIGMVSGVASAIASAAAWIAGVTVQVANAFGGVIGAFGGNSCLATVTRVLNTVSSQFERLAAWAEGGFTGLAEAVSNVFNSIVAILQPILDFLVRLVMVVANPPLLPIAIAGAVWLLIPDELKPPVINFVLDLIIAFLSGFPAFLTGLGPLASILKAGFLGFLEGLRAAEDQQKIDASNKVANLMAGAGIEFIAGFAVGILQGLIDGILDPFRLIWMLIQFLARLCRSLGDYLAPLLFAAEPGLGTAVRDINASVRATIPDHPPAHAPPAAEGAGTTAATGETATLVRSIPGSMAGPTALAPPAGGATASVSTADASPEDAVMGEIMAAGPTASDADIAASLSPGLSGQLTGAAGELDAAGVEGESSAQSEVQSEGSSVGGLADLLGGVWTAILEGAHGLGGRAAGALLEFIMLPDYELGNKVGYVAGLVLLEVIVAYFSGGVSVQLKAAQPFIKAAIRFLDLGGEILSLLGRAVRPIKGPLLRGLSAAGEHLSRFRFLQPIIQRVRRAADTLFHFGDEAADAASRASGRVDDVARHADDVGDAAGRAGARADDAARRADDVADAAGAGRRVDDAAGAGRRADDVAGAGRRADDMADASRRADDVPRVGDDVAQSGGPPRPHGDDAGRAARKAAEMPAALAAAQAICEANDRIDAPPPVVWAELMGLRARFTWIETFRVQPKATPGHFEIHMIASDTTIDRDYTFFRIGPDEMDELITFWQQRVNRMSGTRRDEAERYLRRLREARRRGTPPRTRPTWWQTEMEVAHFYDEAGDALGTMKNRARGTRDVPFIHGRDANFIRRSDGSLVRDDLGRPLYERGHTRPDIIHGSHAIEVKNYRLTDPGDVDRLGRTLEQQIGDRGALHVGPGRGRGGLPADISHQALVIDARGQRLTDAQLREIGDRLIARMNRRLDELAAAGNHAVGRQRFTPDDIQFIVYDTTIRRSASGSAPARVPTSVGAALRRPGRPLPPAVRRRAETSFHADLGHVRVHTDDLAGRAVAESRAHALAGGSHILLGRNRRDFSQPETLATLAHEIAHTLQPRTSGAVPGGFEADDSPAEAEARRAVDLFVGRTPSARGGALARASDRARGARETTAGPLRREVDEDAEDARRREALSSVDWLASIPPIVMDDNAPVLITWARKQTSVFEDAGTSDQKQMYIAQGLLRVHRQLRDMEKRAQRDAAGGLVYRNALTEAETPWTQPYEKHLEEISPFTPLDLVRWKTAAKPLPSGVRRRRPRAQPAEKRKADAQPAAPPRMTGINITFPKQKDMTLATDDGQRVIMAFVIASTRRGLSADQIGWIASQLSTDKAKRWQPPANVDRGAWEAEFEAIPVGGEVTLTITNSFTIEVDLLMHDMPSVRDFQLEGFRQGVVDARGGLYLGIGVFAVGTLALGGGIVLGSTLGAAGGTGVAAGGLLGGEGAALVGGTLGHTVRTVGTYAYLNAPNLYGSAMLYGGAVMTGIGLGQQVQDIRQRGLRWRDIPDAAANAMPLFGGMSDYRTYGGGRTSPSPAPPRSPPQTPATRPPAAAARPAAPTPAAPNVKPGVTVAPAPVAPVDELAARRARNAAAQAARQSGGGANDSAPSDGGFHYVYEGNTVRVVQTPAPAPVARPAPATAAAPQPARAQAAQPAPQVAPTPAPSVAPAPQPAAPPHIAPAPDPARTATTLSQGQATGTSTTTQTAPAAHPAPSPNAGQSQSQDSQSPPLEIRLVLPPQKSIHLARYQSLVRARRLVHQVGVGRQDNGQRYRWDRNLRPPNGAMAIAPEIWNGFEAMSVQPDRRLRPNWTRTEIFANSAKDPLEVDHIVDDQVCRWLPNNGWYLQMSNLELLDRTSNGLAGNQLADNIAEERRDLAQRHGPVWLTAPLIFTTVLPSTGPTGVRWYAEELEQGLHYHALRRLLHARSGR